MQGKISQVQAHLAKERLEGWLLYDFHGNNSLARAFLEIPSTLLTSRRLAYFIPVKGEPQKLVHAIEPFVLDHLPGKKHLYLRWQEWEEGIKKILQGAKAVALEYAPFGRIPYLSKVDAGTVDLVRHQGVEVFSSARLLQHYTSLCDEYQLESHKTAARVLEEIAQGAWEWIRKKIQRKESLTEYDVALWMFGQMESHGCETEGFPLCSVNAHSADPHYVPSKEGASRIQEGDFILIDLWCKQKKPRAVFADITRVGVAASQPTSKQKEIFQIVRAAQRAATHYVSGREGVKGCEVDQVARKVIEEAGYGSFFIHRTGHNIYTENHGMGTHLDSLETCDERLLIPQTIYSVEPGIYLPGEFGVRLEYDIVLDAAGKLMITGGVQEEIETL